MSTATKAPARLGQSVDVHQSFTYADDGRLIKSRSADGVVTIWCYYSRAGGKGPNLSQFADESWSSELPAPSAPAIEAGLPLLPQAQFQYSLIEGVIQPLSLIFYGYPSVPQGRSAQLKSNATVTLEGVLVSNAKEAMTNTETALTLERQNGRNRVSLHCQRTTETLPEAKTNEDGQTITVATTTVTETRYWGTEKVELVTTETRETNPDTGITVRLSSKATDGTDSDVKLSSERRSPYSTRVRQREQAGEQTRLAYDGMGRLVRETTYVNNLAQNDLTERTDAPLKDIETVYKDTQYGSQLIITNHAEADMPSQRIWRDGLQGVVRIEYQSVPGTKLSATNWCPIQYFEQVLDYLPGGLQRALGVGVTPNTARDLLWSAVSEKEGTAPVDANSVLNSEEVLGDVKRIRLIREQSQTNLLNGGVVTRTGERLPAAGSTRSRVQTEKTYDHLARLTQVKHTTADDVDSERVYTIDYDELNRPVSWTAPDGSVVERDYAGISSTVTRIKVKDGQATKEMHLGTQALDGSSRLTSREVGKRRYQFRYVNGRITETELPDETLLFNEESDDGNSQSWKATNASGTTTTLATFKYAPLQNAFEATRPTYEADQQSEVTLTRTASRWWEKTTYHRVTSGLTLNASQHRSLLGDDYVTQHANGSHVSVYRDHLGRRTRVRRNEFEYYYCYNAWGECERLTVCDLKSGNTLRVNYEFDAFGQEIVRRYRINRREVEVYRQEWSSNGQLLSKSLTRDGQVCRTERFGYDNRERLTSWEVDEPTTNWPSPPESGGKTLCSQRYAYDIINNLTNCDTAYTDGSHRRQEYSYSELNPTQRVKILTIETPVSGNATRSEVTMSYDRNGNMTRDDKGRTMSYTLSGRLQAVYNKSGELLTRYEYDEHDRMSMQWHEGEQQSCVLIYSGDRQTGEVWLDKDGKEVSRQQWDNEAGLVEQFSAYGDTAFVLRDPQSGMGTEYLYNNASQEFSYGRPAKFTPWGESSFDRATSVLSSQGYNNLRQDPVTGCYHLGNGYRVYNPSLRMFQQPDSWAPFGAGGLNDYAYCSGDPVNLYDPSGHVMISRWGEDQMIRNLDQLIKDLTPQQPKAEERSLWQTILWSVVFIAIAFVAVLAAIPTGGLSLVLAASALALTVVSSGLSIASVALQNSDPALSEALDTASLVVGFVEMAIPSIKSVIGRGIRMLRWVGSKAGQITQRVGVTLRRVATRAGRMGAAQKATHQSIEFGGTMKELTQVQDQIYMFEDAYNKGRRLNIAGHGIEVDSGKFDIYVREEKLSTHVMGKKITLPNALGTKEITWDARKLYSELINKGVDFHQYDSIRLIMCHSAEGSSSFAAHFSKLTNRPVKGFIQPVTGSFEPGSMLNLFNDAKSAGLTNDLKNMFAQKRSFRVEKSGFMAAGTKEVTIPIYRPEWFPSRPVKLP